MFDIYFYLCYDIERPLKRGVKLRKHKLEIAALTLLLGVLCYAFYDCNIKGSEQEIVLANELLTMKDIKSKDEFTVEMLSLPILEEDKQEKTEKELEREKEENKEEENTNEEVISEVVEEPVYEEPLVEEQVYDSVVSTYSYVSEYNESLATQIVNYALQFVGGPYVYGGNSLTGGTDCSGFTKLVFANFGIDLNRVARDQIYNGVSVGLSNIQPGDIVLSGYNGSICHSSLYIGNGQLVHALNQNVGIVVTDLYIMPIIDVRRVI